MVQPVIVVWGDCDVALNPINGVAVVHGDRINAWLDSQPPTDRHIDVDVLAEGLAAHAAVRWDHEERAKPLSRYEAGGLSGIVGEAGATVASVILTLLAGSIALVAVGVVGLLITIAIAVGGLFLRKQQPRFALAGTAITATAVGLVLIGGSAVAFAVIR